LADTIMMDITVDDCPAPLLEGSLSGEASPQSTTDTGELVSAYLDSESLQSPAMDSPRVSSIHIVSGVGGGTSVLASGLTLERQPDGLGVQLDTPVAGDVTEEELVTPENAPVVVELTTSVALVDPKVVDRPVCPAVVVTAGARRSGRTRRPSSRYGAVMLSASGVSEPVTIHPVPSPLAASPVDSDVSDGRPTEDEESEEETAAPQGVHREAVGPHTVNKRRRPVKVGSLMEQRRRGHGQPLPQLAQSEWDALAQFPPNGTRRPGCLNPGGLRYQR
jgi:hypothetical protein